MLRARYDGLWALGWIHARHRDEQALAFTRDLAADRNEHIWLRAHAAGYLSEKEGKQPAYSAVLAEAVWPSATRWDEVSARAIKDLADYSEESELISKLMIEILESESSDYVKKAAAKTLVDLGPPSAATRSALRALRDRNDSTGQLVARDVLGRWEFDPESKDGETGAQR
jgi:hypothetical protein